MNVKLLMSASIIVAFTITLFAPGSTSAQQWYRRIEIVAKRFDFFPSEIKLKKGEPAMLALTSKDVNHGLNFKEFGLEIRSLKRRTSEVSFTPTRTGDFVWQSSVFCGSGHGSMKLILYGTE